MKIEPIQIGKIEECDVYVIGLESICICVRNLKKAKEVLMEFLPFSIEIENSKEFGWVIKITGNLEKIFNSLRKLEEKGIFERKKGIDYFRLLSDIREILAKEVVKRVGGGENEGNVYA